MGGYTRKESLERMKVITDLDKLEPTKLLKTHSNYTDQIPEKGESLIAYTLRCAAHIVSPPQAEGESYDIECTVIKSAILGLEKEIQERWLNFNSIT